MPKSCRPVAILFALVVASCGDPAGPANNTPVNSITIGGNVAQPIERTVTVPLTATLRDAGNTVLTGKTVTWSSSAPEIASVDPTTGLVTALDRGTAKITATSEGKTATTDIEVIILYRSITAGDGFSCDLGSIGVAHCWGHNGFQDGRLGNGPLDNSSLADSNIPVNVLGTQRFTEISSGERHSCGLTSAGAAYCWGSNSSGQLGATNAPSWAHQPVPVTGGLVFSHISAGAEHTCAITAAGAAYCWGDNGEGQLGDNTQTDRSAPVAVSGGIAFSTISAGNSAGGNSVTCGVATNGRGYCWGSDVYGQIGDGGTISGLTTDIKKVPTQVSGPTTFKSIAVGTFHVCGVITDGHGYCWGNNSSGKLGTGTDDVDESAPRALATTALFSQIELGYVNTCGVTTTFALYCWGSNVYGESGTAVVTGQVAKSPALAAAGEWAEVNLGTSWHTCMVSRDRLSVRCMGANDLGQLGNGTTTGSSVANVTPVLVVKQQP